MILKPKQVAVIGSSGAIGQAFAKLLASKYPHARLCLFSRTNGIYIDYESEESIAQAAKFAAQDRPIDLVVVANGILHVDHIVPEKSLKELSAEKFVRLFEANTVTPSLIAKHFLPRMNREQQTRFAVLSARVGSISDNRLGGWYAYRASKAALNMIIKNMAIEVRRRNKNAIIVGLHPGTVDSRLSKPFQGNVPASKLFSPDYSVERLLTVLEGLTPQQSGKCFAWDGEEILP